MIPGKNCGQAGEVNAPPSARILARGEGWTASDFICTFGPHSRPFEERHNSTSIALVVAGTFQYRSGPGHELMTPGSILLGNPGQYFECAHEHGVGDRCLSISYAPDFFERLAADALPGHRQRGFRALRLPPLRALSGLSAQAFAALGGFAGQSWEEFAVKLAAAALELDRGSPPWSAGAQPGVLARVTRVVRMIEAHPEECNVLGDLAAAARLSPYHFLRTFEGLMGVTPHQYVLRMRLRRAAVRLGAGAGKILDLALDSGFGDVSNFNRAFRAEFGASPRAYRIRYKRSQTTAV